MEWYACCNAAERLIARFASAVLVSRPRVQPQFLTMGCSTYCAQSADIPLDVTHE